MHPRLFHIYGPLWIHSYGVMIALGFLVFLWLTYRHPKRIALISGEQYLNTVFLGLLSGIVGGRLLFVITEWRHFLYNPLEIVAPWEGGFIVLGSIIGVLLVIPAYLIYHRINTLKLLDLASQYAPLMQAIARTGCLLAGCCHGCLAPNLPWAITFTNLDGFAPVHLPLHPTQIYLGLASLAIFFIMTILANTLKTKPGQLACVYLMLESISRFTIDIWRGDRGTLHEIALGSHTRLFVSAPQLYSAIFFALCIIGLLIVSYQKRPTKN